MATINEIAELAGVSRGTVDRVLHNRGHVAPSIEERIKRIAAEKNYKTNKAGKILSQRKNPKKIGIVIQSTSNPFFIDLKNGLLAAAKEYHDLGFNIIIEEVEGFDGGRNLLAIKNLLNQGVDALLLTVPDTQEIIQYLDNVSIPFAAMNSALSSSNCLYYVGADYKLKGKINAGLLSMFSKTKPNILILQGSEKMLGHKQIVDGFLEALDERGTDYRVSATIITDDNGDLIEKEVRARLGQDPTINTVFVSTAGVKRAIAGLDTKQCLVFTSDDTPDVKELIQKGSVAWTITQEAFEQGYHALRKMAEFLLTGDRQNSYLINQIIRIKENIQC